MIETPRLTLRGWREEDVPLHNAMCNDPTFMRHLGPALPMEESAAAAARQNANLANYGACFWVVALKETGAFVGYCGIKPGPEGTPIAGLPEIGWGIAPAYWRQRLAYEAASASLAWGWAERDWPAVSAITSQANAPSWGLMECLGMTRYPGEDFDHPEVPDDSPLKRHILYRIARPSTYGPA